ncbi:DUF3987 domain-containing protein [Streptomyces sp. NPDC051956]|uniref:DUF3987 domain-containing protein n=1 Tax=Streptomyces sp. NPDC051956 TaxID=3365677 RepID=UPI0037CD285A
MTAEAVELAQAAEELTIPSVPQLVADDATPETIGTLLAQQNGRISCMGAEGELFDIIAGRYTGKPNMGMFLKGHAGDMIRVNRQSREAEHIDSPAVTVGLAIQPEVLDSLALADWTDPALLTLTPEADAVMLAFQKVTEARLGRDGSFAPIVKWASKRDGAVARIAGLLHLASHPEDGWHKPIEAATMAAATELGVYFTAHALDVFDTMSADPAHDAALTVLAHLLSSRPPQITKRELFRSLRRADFPAIGDLDPALSLLEEQGWIRQQPPPPRTGRGGRPPSPRYETHPHIGRGA